MNQELAIIKGILAEQKHKKMVLESVIAAHVRAAKSALAGFEFRPLREIDISGTVIQLQEAEAKLAELHAVIQDIEKAEAELN